MSNEYTIGYLTDATAKQRADLAAAYELSYNTLSQKYKSKEEMDRYTDDYFKQRIEKFATDHTSTTFVVYNASNVSVGFARFSDVPKEYYALNQGDTSYTEIVTVDNNTVQFKREIHVYHTSDGTAPARKISEGTVMLNQIYLHPKVQHKGLGTQILASVLPTMQNQFDNILVEYNIKNDNQKFYEKLGFVKIGYTYDLDHIIGEHQYISNVGIAIAPLPKIVSTSKGILFEHNLSILKFINQNEHQ